MRDLLGQIDRLLRGDATRMETLRSGQIDVSIASIFMVTVLMAMVYGFCMGSFAVVRTGGVDGAAYLQLLASALKLPLLFYLTLLITFPSLYVINALVGSRLGVGQALKLLMASMGVLVAVLASLGPIVVFFSVSTTSYPFMKLLNVATCSVSGALGLTFLLRTLHRMTISSDWQEPPPASQEAQSQAGTEQQRTDLDRGALDRTGGFTSRSAFAVFRIWVVVYALVGAQMGWLLRPFIGSPDLPFQWFRSREGNFFEAVFQALRNLLGAAGT